MWGNFWRATLFATLLVPQVAGAQDITLTAREGGLSVSGVLQGFDGEFYRIDSAYGLLTVDASGVICEGPACPDLLAPKADLRVVGLPGLGEAVLPKLITGFAKVRGLDLRSAGDAEGYHVYLVDPKNGKTLADVRFLPASPEESRAALTAGRAELSLAGEVEPGLGSRALALDAMVPVVSPDNPTPEISTRDLAAVLAGEIDNWAPLGGPDMPIVLHGLAEEDPLQRALSARLGRSLTPEIRHADLASLGAAVARDPWALAVTLRAGAGGTRLLPLTDSCGFPLLPLPLAVKAEDYPLALPFYFLTPKRRLPLMVREFLEYLATPAAQSAIAEAGLINRQPERMPLTADGLRLINAIQGAGEETTLADLKRLVDVMDGADRLSLTFRFQDGSATLDAHSRENLSDLARLLEAGLLKDKSLILAGFSDGKGAAAANLDLSEARAAGVLQQLRDLAPGLAESALPVVMGFGEALPMACDETAAGRRLNRRVEVWLKPRFTDNPPNEN